MFIDSKSDYDDEKTINILGGAVAEWSKALRLRENKRKTKDPRFTSRPPRPGQSTTIIIQRTISILIANES